jgi:hypothetical protein
VTRAWSAALLGLAIPLSAVAVHAGSRYSLRGNGEPVLPFCADSRALGGAEAADDEASISGNPASLAFADRTTFYGTWFTEGIRIEEPAVAESGVLKDYDGFLPNLGLVFPLSLDVRMGLGFVVERRQSGRIVQDATTPDGRPYRQVYEASGNLMRTPLLLAFDLRRLQLGGGPEFILLNSKIRWQNAFPVGSGFPDSDDRDESSVWGIGWKVGGRLPISRRLALGAWGSLPGDLSGRHRLKNDSPADSSESLEFDAHGDIARAMGAGVDFAPFGGWRLAADWTREAWQNVEPPNPADEFVDVDRYGAGIEWKPKKAGGLAWPVRLGYRTEPLHVLDGNGRKVREQAVTGGSGLTFADGRGQFDWFAEYFWRGDGASEFQEQGVRIGVTLTGVEDWARRRPPEEESGDW